MVEISASCKSRNASGEQCRARPVRDNALCFWHDPEFAAEAAEARRHGGLRRQREETLAGAYDVDALLAVAVRDAAQENWRELRAIEEQVESMTDEFDGEDVLHPRVRGQFDEAKGTLLKLHEDVQKYTGPFELPDPDEELRAAISKIAEREASNVPTR